MKMGKWKTPSCSWSKRDFATSTILYCGETFLFPALGSVPQSLVVAGGIENLVTEKLKAKLEPAAV